MKIKDQVGGVIVQVGIPSKRHVRFSPIHSTYPVELSFPQWEEMKILVDIMFKITEEMSTP